MQYSYFLFYGSNFMSRKIKKFSRQLHLWVSLAIFIPVVIVIASGLLLQVKKNNEWLQPPTQQGKALTPSLSFEQILGTIRKVPEANIESWGDVDRLDVRPNKGVIKVRSNNNWEIQLDSESGEVLQVAYRRTDTIEAIHDGSWFFEGAKLWVFLPVGLLLFSLWITGLVMLFTTRFKFAFSPIKKIIFNNRKR